MGEVCDIKSINALRGDLMRPGAHFYPYRTHFPKADKATVRLVIVMAAAHGWPMEQMDIKNSHFHEKSM